MEKNMTVMKKIALNPLASKEYQETVKLIVAVAASEPDYTKSKTELVEIYSTLDSDEMIATEILMIIKDLKLETKKAINNRIIDAHQLHLKDDTTRKKRAKKDKARKDKVARKKCNKKDKTAQKKK